MPWQVTTLFSGPQAVGGGVNRLYFSEIDATAAQAASRVVTFWTELSSAMVNTLTWTVLPEVEQVATDGGGLLDVVAVTGGTGTGLITSAALPPANQGLISWRTGRIEGGREVRGRTFVPGTAELSADGQPTAAYRADVAAAAANLIAAGGFVVWSRAKGVVYPAISGSVWTEFAVLRSRRD